MTITEVHNLQVDYCYEPCPTLPAIEVVTDVDGRQVEVVDISRGFRSIRAGPPKLPPLVKRRVFFEVVGTSTILECPA